MKVDLVGAGSVSAIGRRWIRGASPRMTPAEISGTSALFFALSKTLGVILLPSNLLIGLCLTGLVLLFTRFASHGRRLLTARLVLLAVCAWSPLGSLLLYPLEQRFPPWAGTRG